MPRKSRPWQRETVVPVRRLRCIDGLPQLVAFDDIICVVKAG
jgi:hypothetical protein